jgi:hypothetical protein
MMLASLLPSLWVRESGVGEEPLYSPYITSPTVAAAAQAVNRSSGESWMDYSIRHWLTFSRIVVAALAFLVWDILITTDEEVTFLSSLIALVTDHVS